MVQRDTDRMTGDVAFTIASSSAVGKIMAYELAQRMGKITQFAAQ
jgi:hypothetical protein